MDNNSKILSKKLKAIVFTDIVNFTQLSSLNEKHALELIDIQKKIIKPIVIKHNGEWLKEIGDGLLLSFDSSLDAVNCSMEIQKKLKTINDFKIRIGIHQGDIFIKNGDVFGDDVNIASRVESFAPEGGISISDKVYRDISGVKEIKTSFIGHRKLKGVHQETKLRCITSNNLPIHKISKLSYLAGYISYFYGIFALLSILFYSIPEYLIFGESITQFLQSAIQLTIISSGFFVVGYSCLSYYKGVSILSQKLIVTFAYFLAFFPIINTILGWIAYPISLERFLSISESSPSIPIFIFGIPLLIVFLIRIYNKKKDI